jgi:15-cis-phytoene synthase
MPDAFDHCEALVRTADKDRFFATLFAPAARRRPLYALYAFNLEIARVREVVSEPLPGEIRLQWWRDALAGAAHGDVNAHPVAAPLRATIVRYQLPVQRLIELIETRIFDLYDEPMGALAELESYAAKTSATLIELAARILNEGGEPGIGVLAGHAGTAYALAGLLRAFPVHAARRQLYVPLEILDRHGARPEDIFAVRTTVELRAALAEIRARARHHLAAAGPLFEAVPAKLLAALLPVALVDPLLDRMDKSDPFRPIDLPQWRRQWLIWRAARRGTAMIKQ